MLTTIDVSNTLKKKLDLDIDPQARRLTAEEAHDASAQQPSSASSRSKFGASTIATAAVASGIIGASMGWPLEEQCDTHRSVTQRRVVVRSAGSRAARMAGARVTARLCAHEEALR